VSTEITSIGKIISPPALKAVVSNLFCSLGSSNSIVKLPLLRGVAEANCPRAFVLKALTALPCSSFTSTKMFGRDFLVGSLTMPVITFGKFRSNW
jgi:hypothetical protein